MVSLTSYKTTEKLVTEDVNQALAKALDEQQSDVISADTIQVFNVPPTSAGVNGNHPVAVRPTASDSAVVDGIAMGTLLYISARYDFGIVWRVGIAGREFRGCERLHSKTYPHAAATDGDAVEVALAQTVEVGDMRCPLAQERGCQRDALYAYPATEAHHRRTFRPQNRIRQG